MVESGLGRCASAVVTALVLVCAGCRAEFRPSLAPAPACTALEIAKPEAQRSVVLILNDTMRRDRIGAYGGPAASSVFDRFAAEGLLFSHAYSQAPWTRPAIATLFTGLHPSQHGVRSHPADHLSRPGVAAPESDVLPSELTTLAEHLTAAGYETAAFVANPWMRADLGFAQGFDVWNDAAAADDAPGTIVVRAALDWLRNREREGPFFLYIHTMDSHAPYPPLAETTIDAHREALDTDSRRLSPAAQAAILQAVKLQDGQPLTSVGVQPSIPLLKLAYDGGIEQFDAALAELLAGLDARPDASEIAVLVTSDHGEALFERGWASHGYGLFDDEIAIPMAAQLPGVSGPAVVECPVGLIDVMTSLCVYLGIECQGPQFGTPFVRVAGQTQTEASARWIVSEGVIAKPRHRAIRNRDIALLFEPDGRPGRPPMWHPNPFALYTRRDGKEHPEPSVPDELRGELERAVPPFDTPETSRVELDAETKARLEALGYAVPAPAED